jgi:DNA-binding transcriptional LysR family regulator
MTDRLTGMQVFSKAVALGSLSGAARTLGMSQTMATKHIFALEERLGVKILRRTTRKLTLTEPGRRYLESAERILAEVKEAEAYAAAERVEVTGTLRVNAPVTFGAREIAPLLSSFAQLHPALTVDLGLNDRVVDVVEEGWDVVIRIGRIEDQSMIARKLASCRCMVAGAPAYLAERGTPRTIFELSVHNCLGYTLSRTLGPGRWAFGKHGTIVVPIKGNLQANNGDALLAAARAGQGLIYEPTFVVGDAIRTGQLVAIALDHPMIELPGVFAAYPGNRRPAPKVRAFVDFLVRSFGKFPPWDRALGLPD